MSDSLSLNSLSPAPGRVRKAKRVGRGIGSTDGKTRLAKNQGNREASIGI